jgi:hypothetical protein
MFWVGRVRFTPIAGKKRVTCEACGAKVMPQKAAAHARRRHRGDSEGVLAGQLGLPHTQTPDVPR